MTSAFQYTPCSQVSPNLVEIHVSFLEAFVTLGYLFFISPRPSGQAENLFLLNVGVDGWTLGVVVESNVVLLAYFLSPLSLSVVEITTICTVFDNDWFILRRL